MRNAETIKFAEADTVVQGVVKTMNLLMRQINAFLARTLLAMRLLKQNAPIVLEHANLQTANTVISFVRRDTLKMMTGPVSLAPLLTMS